MPKCDYRVQPSKQEVSASTDRLVTPLVFGSRTAKGFRLGGCRIVWVF